MASVCSNSTYQIDNIIRTTGTFTNAADDYNLIDPTFVLCDVTDPLGVMTTYTNVSTPVIVRESAGVYNLDLEFDIPGTWNVRWYSQGSAIASSSVSVRMLP